MPKYARFGWTRHLMQLYFPLPLATTAETKYEEALGFRFVIESAKFYTQVAGTGSGATRTLQISKNGTVIASVAITLAGTSDLGEETAVSLASATLDQLTFGDADVLKIGFANDGTAFTAGAGTLILVTRQQPQEK